VPRARHSSDRHQAIREPLTRVDRAGESALIVRLGDRISPAIHQRVLALLAALDAAPLRGQRDLVPAYASLLIHFEPLVTTPEAVDEAVRRALADVAATRPPRRRPIHIPVHYGDEDGPDLLAVATGVGLTPEEVVRRHAAAEYQVYFLGFLAGFPYLGGLPAELAVPRLDSPRARIPAGSVGIAGQQTGIYPVASPGGWRLIGRTPLRLFDPARDPPALLRPGDRVRFSPVPACTTEDTKDPEVEEHTRGEPAGRSAGPRAVGASTGRGNASRRALPGVAGQGPRLAGTAQRGAGEVPWLRVVRPGPLTTVQDLGRPGNARLGVCACGAADGDALQLGNALLGNLPGTAGLEVTLGGVTLETLAPCLVALTGADCAARVNDRPLRPGVACALAPGDAVELGLPRAGLRAYLCVAGGVAVPLALGSRSTDVRAGLGGVAGRALRAGDTLARGETRLVPGAVAGRRLPADPVRDAHGSGAAPALVRILPGPHAANGSGDLEVLLAHAFAVDPRSDRVGVRLRPTSEQGEARLVGGDILSEGVPHGAVQLPPGGEPIILLADHQTTGGYCIPAVVIAADLWQVAQLRAGDALRLALTTHEAAVAALRARRAWLADLAARYAGATGAGMWSSHEPDTALLMRGFTEWSEEAQKDE
jgi:KipI family sensor histidine kinase inhibitor